MSGKLRKIGLTMAAALVLSPSLVPAFAAGAASARGLERLPLAEMQREFGAGGGSGGDTPTDPIDAGKPQWVYDYSTWVQESADELEVQRISTSLILDQSNYSDSNPPGYWKTYNNKCTVTFSGDATLSTSGSGIKVSGSESCAKEDQVWVDQSPWTRLKVFEGTNGQTTIQRFQLYKVYRDLNSPTTKREATGQTGSRQLYRSWLTVSVVTSPLER
jgi:hypothetical protein